MNNVEKLIFEAEANEAYKETKEFYSSPGFIMATKTSALVARRMFLSLKSEGFSNLQACLIIGALLYNQLYQGAEKND